MLFVLLQRYTFWSNSQHPLSSFLPLYRCLYYCKDTLFEAIHNTYPTDFVSANVVCITAKIHFLKQFTTKLNIISYDSKLFVLLQRYTFWSNSQPVADILMIASRCLYYCKDTLFEAIHNSTFGQGNQGGVVCITAKIHFLKQFTTLTCH